MQHGATQHFSVGKKKKKRLKTLSTAPWKVNMFEELPSMTRSDGMFRLQQESFFFPLEVMHNETTE